MNIIAYGPLREFADQHPNLRTAIKAWYKIANAKSMEWRKPQDIVDTFGSERVDILKNNRVCINIGGNNARLILKVDYEWNVAFVRWIGWNKDYDNLGDAIHTI